MSPKTIKDLRKLIKNGEGPCLEFKRSTGELKEALQALCAFLNGNGGTLIFGVTSEGILKGQQVSDKTLREITQALDKFDPAIIISPCLVKINKEKSAIVLSVEGGSGPCTYDGRAYERVSSSTRRMSQSRYEQILLDRRHETDRWENYPAVNYAVKEIDQEEVFRIVRIAESVGRLTGPVSRDVQEVLKRLKLYNKDGKFCQAAVVLFGKEFLPDYPQCELRMARFRGTDKTEFLDQKNVRGPAFKLLEEAEIFCQRHFPLPARIVPTQLHRLEKPLIPPDAMREILVNALIHRDYSVVGGAISLAIFDDRVEVWSAGKFPNGITPAKLTKIHDSIQRNPLIAETFHRAGLIEKWGRGTNRVIEMCKAAGIPAPKFEEITGAAVVTFFVNVGVTLQVTPQDVPQITAQVTAEVTAQVVSSCQIPRSAKEIMAILGLRHWKTFQTNYLRPLIDAQILKRTIPDKPNSRLQKYQLTEKGQKILKNKR